MPLQTTPSELQELDILVQEKSQHKIVVYNDDINTFDWVIDSFVNVLQHQLEQAEQCAYLIHYKGRCIVKSGDLSKIRPFKEALTERGLRAVIEE